MSEWIDINERKPDQIKVRIKITDGSEINCWAQSDGDFYWSRGNGGGIYIPADDVTHWMPRPV